MIIIRKPPVYQSPWKIVDPLSPLDGIVILLEDGTPVLLENGETIREE